jgi:hypothetical protein
MSPKTLLIVLGLGTALAGLFIPLYTASFSTSTYTVPGGEILDVSQELNRKDRVVGFFSIRGNPPEIGFQVYTPGGEPLHYHFEPPYVWFLDQDVVVARHNFNFYAREPGGYVLRFNNTNYTSAKQIIMKITVMPAFLGIHPTNLFLVLGFGMVFLAYLVEDLVRKKYVEVLPQEFRHVGDGIFVWEEDSQVRLDLNKRVMEVLEDLKRFGLKPRSKWGFYYALRNRAGLE